MPPEMAVREVCGWTVLSVDGELDVYTAPRLREQLIDLIASGQHNLVVNMDAVTFIDSTGLGVLIGALKRVRAVGGELRVVATLDPVLRTMRITGLHRVFGAFDSVDMAATTVPATGAGAPQPA